MSDWTHRSRDRFSEPDPENRPRVGDAVTVTEGTFESFEGTLELIDAEHGKITVIIELFGRATPIQLEYWQVKKS